MQGWRSKVLPGSTSRARIRGRSMERFGRPGRTTEAPGSGGGGEPRRRPTSRPGSRPIPRWPQSGPGRWCQNGQDGTRKRFPPDNSPAKQLDRSSNAATLPAVKHASNFPILPDRGRHAPYRIRPRGPCLVAQQRDRTLNRRFAVRCRVAKPHAHRGPTHRPRHKLSPAAPLSSTAPLPTRQPHQHLLRHQPPELTAQRLHERLVRRQHARLDVALARGLGEVR